MPAVATSNVFSALHLAVSTNFPAVVALESGLLNGEAYIIHIVYSSWRLQETCHSNPKAVDTVNFEMQYKHQPSYSYF